MHFLHGCRFQVDLFPDFSYVRLSMCGKAELNQRYRELLGRLVRRLPFFGQDVRGGNFLTVTWSPDVKLFVRRVYV